MYLEQGYPEWKVYDEDVMSFIAQRSKLWRRCRRDMTRAGIAEGGKRCDAAHGLTSVCYLGSSIKWTDYAI